MSCIRTIPTRLAPSKGSGKKFGRASRSKQGCRNGDGHMREVYPTIRACRVMQVSLCDEILAQTMLAD